LPVRESEVKAAVDVCREEGEEAAEGCRPLTSAGIRVEAELGNEGSDCISRLAGPHVRYVSWRAAISCGIQHRAESREQRGR